MIRWKWTPQLGSKSYTCWHCWENISSELGYTWSDNWQGVYIYICHSCAQPTYFPIRWEQIPWVSYWSDVNWIEDELIIEIYDEARECFSINAFTACAMLCRKLLMHVAVAQWANQWMKFIEYVSYLAYNHYVSPNSKDWVDEIRKMWNEVNHEIKLTTEKDAKELIDFVVMLLTLIYDFPSRFTKSDETNDQ